MIKKAQIGIEYIIMFSFLSFVLIVIVSIAFFYSFGIKDELKITQVSNYANKIVSTAETVFYYGNPSKATIRVYLPDGVQAIEATDEGLIIETQLNSGISKNLYSSVIPLEGNVSISPGIHIIVITAYDTKVTVQMLS